MFPLQTQISRSAKSFFDVPCFLCQVSRADTAPDCKPIECTRLENFVMAMAPSLDPNQNLIEAKRKTMLVHAVNST